MEITEDTGKRSIHGLVETTAQEEKAQERIECEEMETSKYTQFWIFGKEEREMVPWIYQRYFVFSGKSMQHVF